MSAKKQENLAQPLPVGSSEKQKLNESFNPRLTHGGPVSAGRRKLARPYSPNSSIHLLLQSSRARGPWSLNHRKHRAKIQAMIYRYAERFEVRVFRARNAGHSLQLLVRAKDRKNLADFLRVLAGRVAVTATGAQKFKKRVGKFWDFLCWSKLINWGADFHKARSTIAAAVEPTTEMIEELISNHSFEPLLRLDTS